MIVYLLLPIITYMELCVPPTQTPIITYLELCVPPTPDTYYNQHGTLCSPHPIHL